MSFNLDKELLLRIQSNIEYIKEQVHKLELNNVKKLSEMNEVLIKQESNIQEHIRRTEINEKKLDIFELEIKPILESLNAVKILFMILSSLVAIVSLYLKFK